MDATSSRVETSNVNSSEKDNINQDTKKKSAEGSSAERTGESNSTTGSFECNICLDTAKDAVVSMCGHLFCWPCLHCWLETAEARLVCPVCKAAISRDKVRVKYRYLVCFASVRPENSSDQLGGYPGCQLGDQVAMSLTESNLVTNIRRHIQFAHGSLGVGQLMARFRIIHWCPASGLLVLRCLRDAAIKIQTALGFISEIETSGQKRSALIDVCHMSGTVRGCQKFLVSFYSRQLYSRPDPEFRTALRLVADRHLIAPYPPVLEDQLS